MTEGGTVAYRVQTLEQRVTKLESYEPAVMAAELRNIRDEVGSLRRAFYTFAFGVVASSIVFAFTVFSLLGK